MLLTPLRALALPSALAAEPAPSPLLLTVAYADEDEDQGEEGDGAEDSPSKKPKARPEDERSIREIVRGFYARANIGAAAY